MSCLTGLAAGLTEAALLRRKSPDMPDKDIYALASSRASRAVLEADGDAGNLAEWEIAAAAEAAGEVLFSLALEDECGEEQIAQMAADSAAAAAKSAGASEQQVGFTAPYRLLMYCPFITPRTPPQIPCNGIHCHAWCMCVHAPVCARIAGRPVHWSHGRRSVPPGQCPARTACVRTCIRDGGGGVGSEG